MTAIRWSSLALRDLRRIWYDIALHDIAAADRFEAALKQRLRLTADFPGMGTPLPNGDRKLTIGRYPYFVRYRERPGEVVIVTIDHMARQRP